MPPLHPLARLAEPAIGSMPLVRNHSTPYVFSIASPGPPVMVALPPLTFLCHKWQLGFCTTLWRGRRKPGKVRSGGHLMDA